MAGEALLPKLDEAQRALMVALEEACAADLAKLDTPELIRIDETLDVASKAAKEAISMRLRLDSRSGAAGKQPSSSVEVPATDASAPIPHRVFDDSHGKRWHAFAVQSSSALAGRAPLPDVFRGGWLVFDSVDEVRRVAPIPEGWVHFPVDKLRLLCQDTQGVRKRARSVDKPEDPDTPVTS